MFGKTGVFCDGVMLGMVTENTLYVRVDDHKRAAFQEAASYPPLNYEKQGSSIDLAFGRVPERLFDEPDGTVTWARAALAAAHRVAAKARTGAGAEAVPACRMIPRGTIRQPSLEKLVAGGGLEPPTPAL